MRQSWVVCIHSSNLPSIKNMFIQYRLHAGHGAGHTETGEILSLNSVYWRDKPISRSRQSNMTKAIRDYALVTAGAQRKSTAANTYPTAQKFYLQRCSVFD